MTASTDWGHPGFMEVNLVETFGIDNTGGSAVGAKINAALLALSLLTTSGQVARLPFGTYLIDQPIVVPDGMRVRGSGAAGTVMLGALLVFGSSLTYSLYLSGSAPMIARLGAMRFTALVMIVSAIAAQAHFFVILPVRAYILPLRIYAYVIAIVAFSTVLPMFMQSASIARIGAARSVLIGTLGPVLTIFFSWWILDEPMSFAQMAGTGLVLAGVLLATRR